MSTKQQEKPNISPVLFITVEGEPMSFFLRPGPVKSKLHPLIKAGGGMLCNVQKPGAILLVDPAEKGYIPESTAHWYVSTQYIHDCIEKDEQLNLEDYRFNPEVVQRHSARLNNTKASSLSGGRAPYTAEDDAAILSYISKHKTDVGGNRLWQEMEKHRVTSHSWQSMKYRYRVRLVKKGSDSLSLESATTDEDGEAAEGENKVEGDQEKKDENDEKPSSEGASPQVETDLTQLDAEDLPAETSKAETVTCPQTEVQPENPQADKQLAGSTDVDHVEAEISISIQSEEPCLEPPADAHLIPSQSTEPKTDEPPTIPSTQRESVPDESPPEQPRSLTKTSSQKKLKEKRKTFPTPEEPQRRSTRRQLQLKESPEPYGKRLRSSLGSIEQPSSSPKLLKEKSAVKSNLPKDTADEPPPKKARGKSVRAAAESPQQEGGRAAVSDQAQADNEASSMSRKEGKKKGKKNLGILAMAAREFESESEPEEENTSNLQNSTETVTMKPVETEPALPSQDTPSTQSSPEPGPSLQQNISDTGASTSNYLPTTGCPEPAASEVVDAAAKPHLFIFDSESQKEDCQCTDDDSEAPADQQPTVNQDPFSLTQVQLEEDKQRIRVLMKETNKDLVTVTKALLKTSGDFSDALDLLSNPSSFSGRFWRCSDDDLLLSGDLAVRQQLQEKYGEKLVAKRIVFLELEGCN